MAAPTTDSCWERGFLILLVLNLLTLSKCVQIHEDDKSELEPSCTSSHKNVWVAKEKRYLLYDVNPGEGFNLRRDVYMRIAVLAKRLRELSDWILVLPPWGRIYHWKSREIDQQIRLPWSKFFDLASLNKYTAVIEFEEYIKEYGKPEIDSVYYLQNFEDAFADGHWNERYAQMPCREKTGYKSKENGDFSGWFYGYPNVVAKHFWCLSVEGHSGTLVPFLNGNTSAKSILLDRGEVILHDEFGGHEYWQVRKSMRFSKELTKVGDAFRKKYLNSTDENDRTTQPEDWRVHKGGVRKALGGPFLAVHLRRQDFVWGRPKDVASIESAAAQLKTLLQSQKLSTVFVATDADEQEYETLKRILPNVIRFEPTAERKRKFLDGGIAIIDQWICAHARFFVGTHESTFSFRIQEEREILGFEPDMTFNRLCGDKQKTCVQPTRWKIVH